MPERGSSDGERGDAPAPFSEGMFRTIYHSVNDGIFVHDAESGAILDVNETACDMYGYTRAEFRDLSVADLSSGRPPYTQETAADHLQRAAGGEPQVFEWQAVDSEGDRFWVEVSMRRALVDEDPYVLVIVRDIEERKRRGDELRALTEEYEAIFENAPDAIFLADVDSTGDDVTFRYERLNPAHEATSGLTTEEIRGKTPREAHGEDYGATLAEHYRRCVETAEPITYEQELPMPDGGIVWQTNLMPITVDGEVTRLVGISRDITEQVERERRLEQQKERLEEFAGVIAHDLRNPLHVAQGRTTLLAEQCDDEHREHLEPLTAALNRMEAIIEDTLMLAREGRTVSEPEPIALSELVGQCWGMVETGDARIQVDAELTIRGDRERLRHVFENLFRNAVEHGGPTVTVRVGRAGPDAMYVEDDGPGIPAEKREEVFQPGQSSADGTTGFGLTIVRRIAEAHGWEVAIAEGTEGGARFEFSGVEIIDPAA